MKYALSMSCIIHAIVLLLFLPILLLPSYPKVVMYTGTNIYIVPDMDGVQKIQSSNSHKNNLPKDVRSQNALISDYHDVNKTFVLILHNKIEAILRANSFLSRYYHDKHVLVAFDVSDDGVLSHCHIEESSGSNYFDRIICQSILGLGVIQEAKDYMRHKEHYQLHIFMK